MLLLRQQTPDCRITLSTHFAEQDREFDLWADEFIERNEEGDTYGDIYAPTVDKITGDSICLHVGGDNYCYKNWRRWAVIHCAALERGAKSILWSCSVDPQMLDSEMLAVLRTHHCITAREGETYRCLTDNGMTNVIKVSDVAFMLESKPVDFKFDNYVTINVSPLVIKRNFRMQTAYQSLIDYILDETNMNIALVPHVVQPVDNDYDALRLFDTHCSERVRLVSDKLSAGQYKTIIGKSRFCVAARTHVAVAAYSSCVPTLAVSYSVKSRGLANDLHMSNYVAGIEEISDGTELATAFRSLVRDQKTISSRLRRQMPSYIKESINERILECL
jgi:polysaccharide pyruvyl transferase WcaK-like protein